MQDRGNREIDVDPHVGLRQQFASETTFDFRTSSGVCLCEVDDRRLEMKEFCEVEDTD